MKKIDRYIAKYYLQSFFFSIWIFITIGIVFDISEKMSDFIENEAPLISIITYYVTFIPWLFDILYPLFILISVIFFSSKLAAKSEIIAIFSAGVSIHRLLLSYFISAFTVTIVTLIVVNFLLPYSETYRTPFVIKYVDNTSLNKELRNHNFQAQKGLFVEVRSYNEELQKVTQINIKQTKGDQWISHLTAQSAQYIDSTKSWKLTNVVHKQFLSEKVEYVSHSTLDTAIPLHPKQITQDIAPLTELNTLELNQRIEDGRELGSIRLPELIYTRNQRLTGFLAIFIFTLLGFTLSYKKKRRGTGANIFLGILCGAIYYLIDRSSQIFMGGGFSPLVAVLLPKLLFICIAIYLYIYSLRS